MSRSRLREVVSYEAKQLIPYPLDEVVWDFHRIQNEEDDSGEMQIALICCRRDIVADSLSLLDQAGLNVAALQVGPLATVNYIRYEEEPQKPLLILDTGARSTDFVVMNDDSFWLRSIGVSGTDLSKSLMSKFSIPYEEAETLKAKMGDSTQADRVFRVVQPVLRSLCGEVQRSIGYYKSLFRGVMIEEVMCAGNTYLLPGIDQFVADNVNMPMRTFAVPESVDIDPDIADEVEANRQVIAAATGLALQGVGVADIDISLLPPERRMARLVHAKLKYAVLAVLVTLAAVVLNILLPGDRSENYAQLVGSVNEIVTKGSQSQKEYNEIKTQFGPETERNFALANMAPTRGFLLEASSEVLAVVEKINRSRRNAGQSIIAPLVEREVNRYVMEWPEVGRDEDLRKILADQVMQRLHWQYDRHRHVFINNITCEVIEGSFKKEVVDPKAASSRTGRRSASATTKGAEPKLEFVFPEDEDQTSVTDMNDPLGGRRSTRGRRSSRGRRAVTRQPTYEIVKKHVVLVTIDGYVVSKEMGDAIALKDMLGAIPGVVTRPIRFNPTAGSQNSIRVPVIVRPQMKEVGGKAVEGGAAAGGMMHGNTSMSADAQSDKKFGEEFEEVRESVIAFTASLAYEPNEFTPKVEKTRENKSGDEKPVKATGNGAKKGE